MTLANCGFTISVSLDQTGGQVPTRGFCVADANTLNLCLALDSSIVNYLIGIYLSVSCWKLVLLKTNVHSQLLSISCISVISFGFDSYP